MSGAIDEDAPLSISQERQVLAEEYGRLKGWRRPAVNLASCRRVQGRLNVDAFQRAVNQLIARHAALRTVVTPSTAAGDRERREAAELFGQTGFVQTGLYKQLIEPTAAVELSSVRDTSRLSPERRLAMLSDLMTDELAIPFEYAAPPLIRTHVLRVSAEEHVIVLVMPHLAGDMLSIPVCWKDLWQFYEGDRPGAGEGRLDSPPLQYTAFARGQQEAIRAGMLSASVDYWRRQWAHFEDAQVPPAELADAGHLGMAAGSHSAHAVITLAGGVAVRVRELARRMRVTPSTICLTAYAALLHALTGRPRIAVWRPFANRLQSGAEHAVGWFAHYHMVGLDLLEHGASWRDLILHCRAQMAQALTHQAVPLPLLWQAIGRRAERPHPRVAFDWHVARVAPAAEGLTIDALPAVTWRCVFPPAVGVFLRMYDDGQTACAQLMHTAGIFGPGVAPRMLEQYRQMLEALCADVDGPVPRAIPAVPAAESHETMPGVESLG